MFTFVQIGKCRINLDNIDYIQEAELNGNPKVWIYFNSNSMSFIGNNAIKLLHIIDVRALGRSVPTAEGE